MASYFPMVKNANQRIIFPILDADGDPVTGCAGDTPDSEYSLDGASFVDCNDEIHEIATTSGIYYLDLLAAETNADVVCIQIKTATAGTKTTVLVFYTSAQSLDTVDTVVDGIQTDLSNATDGLGALKALIDALQTQVDTTGVALLASAVDDIWDEVITTSIHFGADTAGKLLRELWQTLLSAASAQCGGVGTANTIELNGSSSSIDDFYKGQLIAIVYGTGIGQARTCIEYDGATKIATVNPIWGTIPNGTSWYAVLNVGSSSLVASAINEIADQVWDELIAAHLGAGSTGEKLNAAGAAGDPWGTVLPGAYATGTAGERLGMLHKMMKNKWEIVYNSPNWQMVFYDDDGTTPLYAFNLTRGGMPASLNPDTRTPV